VAKIYVTSFIDDEGLAYALAFMDKGKEEYYKENWKPLIYRDLEEANAKFSSLLAEREREDKAIPYNEEQALRFVESFDWKFASSYASFAPHEYLVKNWLSPEAKLNFERFVALIKAKSVDGYYYNRKNKYFFLGDYYYWPCGYDNLAIDLINRATISQLVKKNGKYYYGGNKL